MHHYSRFILFLLIFFLSTNAHSDQIESPYAELLRILDEQWLYKLDREEVHKCMLSRIVNSMSFKPDNRVVLPSCFDKDPYISLKFPTNHKIYLTEQAATPNDFVINKIPSNFKDVSFGHISFTKEVPNKNLVQKYFSIPLAHMRQSGITAYVIDMNSNRGGSMSGAAEFLRVFAPWNSKNILFESRKRDGSSDKYTSITPGFAANTCVAILVNRYTASAAEIIAYALQQQMHAFVVGTRTKRKGVSQIHHDLQNGASINFTTGKIFFPDGTTIHKRGVVPNFITNDEHTQWEQARAYLHTCYLEKTAKNKKPRS